MNHGDRNPGPDSRCKALLAALVLTLAPAAHAQLRIGDVPSSVLRPSGIRDSGTFVPGEVSGSWQPSAAPGMPVPGTGWLAGSIQLEVPRDAGTGQYTRPRIVAGFPSETMRNWLNSSGLAAERCMLPMLRARTRMTSDGDIDGTFWLHARCTFH